MDRARAFRGWMAATTVAIIFTLILLAVEKHLQLPSPAYFRAAGESRETAASTADRGILLTVDPGLAGTEQYPPTDEISIARRLNAADVPSETQTYLRRPPEPAASAALKAPVAAEAMLALPMHASSSNLDALMDAMDEALTGPMQTVSARRDVTAQDASLFINTNRLASLPSPAMLSGRIPEPKRLLQELAWLRDAIAPSLHFSDRENNNRFSSGDGRRSDEAGGMAAGQYVSGRLTSNLSAAEADQIQVWLVQVQTLLNGVVMQHGLEHPQSQAETVQLAALAAQANLLGESLTDHEMASRLMRTGYSLQRRVAVWQAIQGCLDGTSIALNKANSPSMAREELTVALAAVELKLNETGDGAAWREYLLLDALENWLATASDVWSEGNELALKVLSRLDWKRLSATQQRFLSQPEFTSLAENLTAWSRDPVDYRQLLQDLEQLESQHLSRSETTLASAVQILRTSTEVPQREVASALNNHYRNANLRLNISREFLERFMPSADVEIRPVRQRILGADTRGDSTVQTDLNVTFIPDDTAWNIAVGVAGDLYSNTRSSKGPATFHNTSTAQILSGRYVRLDPIGYRVSSEPTSVNSQDYLRKMSTDFDGLPIIGDFVRLIVREQFDQKRGLAQRITRRIIAQEADAELDKRLQENLAKAERELKQRIIGPLEQLSLNPMVVSMNTTEDRLAIRYRLASPAQMAAYTPRPRAPTDSLISTQLHQSAINNTIAKIGLGGRTWTLEELYQRLGEVFQQTAWTLPEDVPADVEIRFANRQPASVEMEDGKLRLTLRIAELRSGDRLHITGFEVTTTYIPIADGLRAELIRDGVVEIKTARRHARDRFPLRVIFAKVFVSRPQIPLISEAWSQDPRAAGLAVSQVEIRDGWLAVAVSSADSELAAEVAARARELQKNY